jgi:putative hydroxymethylpyrimidine transport system permease protein
MRADALFAAVFLLSLLGIALFLLIALIEKKFAKHTPKST